MTNKKSYNESVQKEDRYDEALDRNIVERARDAGINLNPIFDEIMGAVKNVGNIDGVCTNSDVKLFRIVLIEKVQQILSRYQINEIEIGGYPDSYLMDGHTEVRIILASSGRPYEQYSDGRIQNIEMSSYVLEQFHGSKRILCNLFDKLLETTEKNRAKIREMEGLDRI